MPGIRQGALGIPLDAKQHEVTLPSDRGREQGRSPPSCRATRRSRDHRQGGAREAACRRSTTSSPRTPARPTRWRSCARSCASKLLEGDEKQAREELKGDLVKELLKRNTFLVAPALVERQLDNMIQRSKLQLAMRGIDYRSAVSMSSACATSCARARTTRCLTNQAAMAVPTRFGC